AVGRRRIPATWSPLRVVLRERQRRVDQPDVAEGLREVAELLVGFGVDLFGEQAEVVPPLEESDEDRVRLVEPAEAGERLDEPERANEERAFAAGKAVRAQVPVDELRTCEVTLDRLDGGDDAGVVGRKEPHQRDDEERGIEAVAGRAGEGAERVAVAVVENPRADRIAGARDRKSTRL